MLDHVLHTSNQNLPVPSTMSSVLNLLNAETVNSIFAPYDSLMRTEDLHYFLYEDEN